MTIAISKHGYKVYYTCYKRLQKCPDENSDKCLVCKYCKAEMDAYDATRLLNSIGKKS